MDEESNLNLEKCADDVPMDSDEGPLINENSNGLSHFILTENEFGSVDAPGADESSTSNQGFLNAVELSAESEVYLENDSRHFNNENFDVGDNAISFPNESITNLSEPTNDDSIDADAVGDKITVGEILGTDNHLKHLKNTLSNEKTDTLTMEVDSAPIVLSESSQDGINENSEDVCLVLNNDKEVSQDGIGQETSGDGTAQEASLDGIVQDISQDGIASEPNKGKDEKVVERKQPLKVDGADELSNTGDVGESEDAQNKGGGAEETEVVSEDELPVVEKPSVKDAENVSDDELPGPKPAELPADTEVVSEDELPSSKKEQKESGSRKRKTVEDSKDETGSTADSDDSASKKQAVVKNGESKPVPSEKRSSTDEKPKKKVLPELDKYWKVVNDDPTDFTGWTYLLQYVDQESDVEAAREAYDAFLSHYPYCYGYWRKYADYEKRKGSKKKCFEVLEKGLKAIPLSVDLWIHFLNHIKTTRTEEHAFIREQYERAIDACGLEFRSDRLWESYIKWEAENGTALHVTNIYDRLLATPTLGYTAHFDNFQEHVMSEPVSGVIDREELVRLRADVREATPLPPPALDLPPGEDEPEDHIASDEEAQAIKERVIAARRKVHKTTGEQVAQRWTFEEGIKRPYFHVKPLERCQLKNWKAYLEWEKQHGSFKRALVLHERCLIACALYEEFWLRLVRFLEEKIETDPSLISQEREVLERACTVHHLDKPALHLHWAYFEEVHGNSAKAAEILERIEKTCPNLVQIAYRRVNLERRRGDLDKCSQLYESYISSAKNKAVASALAIKYARFQHHVRHDTPAAIKVLDDAIEKDPLTPRLYLQRLDLALHLPDTPYEKLAELVEAYEKREGAEPETAAMFAWRRLELAEELGDAAAARAAHAHHRALAKHLRKRARKDKEPPPTPSSSDSSKKKESSSNTSSTPTNTGPAATGNNYYQPPAAPQQQYDQSYQPPYQPPPWGYQQPPAPYHQPWPQYPNYY